MTNRCRAGRTMFRSATRSVVTAVAVLTAMAGCSAAPVPSSTGSTPCGSSTTGTAGAEGINLGKPLAGGSPARITVSDATQLGFTAAGFQHGGAFDPVTGIVQVSLGPWSSPPAYDPQRSQIEHTTVEFMVTEGTVAVIEVPEGDYWVLASKSVSLSVLACNGASFTAVPAGGS